MEGNHIGFWSNSSKLPVLLKENFDLFTDSYNLETKFVFSKRFWSKFLLFPALFKANYFFLMSRALFGSEFRLFPVHF